jgi:hypothetical protein
MISQDTNTKPFYIPASQKVWQDFIGREVLLRHFAVLRATRRKPPEAVVAWTFVRNATNWTEPLAFVRVDSFTLRFALTCERPAFRATEATASSFTAGVCLRRGGRVRGR